MTLVNNAVLYARKLLRVGIKYYHQKGEWCGIGKEYLNVISASAISTPLSI